MGNNPLLQNWNNEPFEFGTDIVKPSTNCDCVPTNSNEIKSAVWQDTNGVIPSNIQFGIDYKKILQINDKDLQTTLDKMGVNQIGLNLGDKSLLIKFSDGSYEEIKSIGAIEESFVKNTNVGDGIVLNNVTFDLNPSDGKVTSINRFYTNILDGSETTETLPISPLTNITFAIVDGELVLRAVGGSGGDVMWNEILGDPSSSSSLVNFVESKIPTEIVSAEWE